MKILFKKLKRISKIKKGFYLFTILLYLVSLILFIINLLKLSNIETFLRIIAIIIFSSWFFIYLLSGLTTMISKKNKTYIIITTISIIFSAIFIVGTYFINMFLKGIDFSKNYINYTSNMIVLKEKTFNDSSVIGMINKEDDIEGYILAQKIIEKENLSQEIKHYDDYLEMLADLYEGKIDSCFVSNNYVVLFSGEEKFENIENEVEVIYTYTEKMENKDYEIKSDKPLTDPFTLLLMGVDSTIDGLEANQAFNGDTLMLISFNPNTLTATMFSVPRDLYVPIACRNGARAKINSSAAYGTSCVINTIHDLTGIDIDYFVKINFKGVVDLVEAINGISVEVPVSFCEQDSNRMWGKNEICLSEGMQDLNGEETLALARHRHSYLQADITRTQVQQKIVESIAKKATTIRSLEDFQKILDAVSKNIDTNMERDKILSFYNVGKNILSKVGDADELIKIQKTYLEYYSLPVYTGSTVTSAIGYYEPSLKAITDAIKVNLELQEEEPIKTFHISYNEEYEPPIIGKGIVGGTKEETLPNFVGSSLSYTESWLQQKGINYSTEYASSYDGNYGNDIIIDQSVHNGTLLSNISSITIYINNPNIAPSIDNASEENNETIIIDNEE